MNINLLHLSTYPVWLYVYITLGILIWLTNSLRNIAVTFRNPNQASKTIGYGVLDFFTVIPFWPIMIIAAFITNFVNGYLKK